MSSLIHKYTNEHSRFLVIDGVMIHYRDEGQGPPIILIHGAFSSLHTFNDWTNHLKENYRVIRYDLPGFGLTGQLDNHDYSIKNHIYFLNALLDRLGIKTCMLAGSSLGGWLAWEYSLSFPARVKKLVLVDAAGFLDSRSIPTPFKMARTPFLNNVIKYVIRKEVLISYLKDVYFDKSKVTDELIMRYYELFSKKGNSEAFVRLVNSKPKDNTKHLKYIQTPTLILWGKEDAWIPVENAYRFHDAIPKNELIIYDCVGHIPMEEIPKQSFDDLLLFLKSK